MRSVSGRFGWRWRSGAVALGGIMALGGCTVVPPSGPTVMALPGKGKSFDVFQQEDNACRYYAAQQTGFQPPGQAGTNAAVGSAVLGTALGAAAGAAIGSVSGNMGAGAAIGGATGLVGGSMVGAGNAAASEADLQQRYNISYTQCMYAHGNTVVSRPPGYGYGGYGGYGYGGSGYYGYGAPAYRYAPGYSPYYAPTPGWGW